MVHVILALLVLALIAIGVITGGTITESVFTTNTSDDDTMTDINAPAISHHIVATDPRTWPSGDKIWDCCRAIAIAEGYNQLVNGQPSNPARLNNPGDLSDGRTVYGSEFHSGSNITTFPDAQTGWSWLYSKIDNAASGRSHVYSPSMTWYEIGQKYAPPNWKNWAQNVAGSLGVDPNSTLGAYVNG